MVDPFRGETLGRLFIIRPEVSQCITPRTSRCLPVRDTLESAGKNGVFQELQRTFHEASSRAGFVIAIKWSRPVTLP